MKLLAITGFLAILGYASAQCGCLKCSKHLTVIGKTIPTGNCPPTTIISREPPRTYVGQTLPLKMQTPAAVEPPVAAPEELRYKVVECFPYRTVRVVQPSGARYNAKVEVPVPSTATSTSINLRPCVDRIIVPSAPRGGGRIVEESAYVNPIREGPVYVNPIREPVVYVNPIRDNPVYVNPIRDNPVYVNPIRDNPVYVNPIRGNPVCANPIRDNPVYVNPIRGNPVCASPIRDNPVYVNPIRGNPICANPIRDNPVYVNPIRGNPVCANPIRDNPVYANPIRETVYVNKSPSVYVNQAPANPSVVVNNPTPVNSQVVVNSPRPVGTSCGPILSNHIVKKFISRYENLYYPFPQVCNDSLTENNRSKREVPFLKHGYKFMINMLPKFIQDPIKSTVNDLAFTHPDERFQRTYGQPQKLTLLEKLQVQRENNMALLKKKLQNRKMIRNIFSLGKGSATLQPPKLFSRSEFADRNQNIDDDDDATGFLEKTHQMEWKTIAQLKKALLKRKLNEDQSRSRRSTLYKNHWSQRRKTPSKKRSTLFDSSEIVLPFYQVKEEDSTEDSHSYPWEKYSPLVSKTHRNRRDDVSDDFLQPYSFRDAATENFDTKEHLLRSVIREELGKYKVHKEAEPHHYAEPLLTENNMPHSPILHVISLPLRLISRFSDITKQAFPILGSIPQMITGSKKYFKDFGKNFKKHFLHLTSDIIGDFENLDVTHSVFGPVRHRRSSEQSDEGILELKNIVQDQYTPNYFFDGPYQDPFESKVREKRYFLKKVDEDEIEEYLLEKLRGVFDGLDGPITTESYPFYHAELDSIDREEETQKKLVLQHLRPKIILDNNGKPFMEVNGFKRPLFRTTPLVKTTPLVRATPLVRKTPLLKNTARKLGTKHSYKLPSYYDTSEEADSEKIDSLIHHAKNHLESTLGSKYSEMPSKTIKEKISQLLFETDILVHMNFEKYDDIYDSLLALQHMKNSIVEDWRRLIMSKAIDDIGAKTLLLERFKELQYYKDVTLVNVVAALYEDNENVFVAKKLIKMLVRLQKLQCLINQVVSNFHGHLHISSKSDIEKEIKYVDFLSSLNFTSGRSRNDMIRNLMKDRDAALQKNIFLLDKLKKLLMYEATSNKVEKEAELLWEIRNIEKMQKTTIEEMKQRLDSGYKIKNELKILFDLLRRYETCEDDQRRLLSKFKELNGEEEEKSTEQVQSKHKNIVPGKKIDLEELQMKWRERLRKRNLLIQKQLKRNMRKFEKKSNNSDDD